MPTDVPPPTMPWKKVRKQSQSRLIPMISFGLPLHVSLPPPSRFSFFAILNQPKSVIGVEVGWEVALELIYFFLRFSNLNFSFIMKKGKKKLGIGNCITKTAPLFSNIV